MEQPSQQIKLSNSKLLTLKEDPLPYIGTYQGAAVPAWPAGQSMNREYTGRHLHFRSRESLLWKAF